MRKTILYVLAWFAAGAGAVAMATASVSMVGHQVTGSRPSPLSAAEVSSALATDSATTTTTPDGGTTTVVPLPPTSTTRGPVTSPPTSRPGGPGTPSTTIPTTVPATPSTTRTYVLVGGTATLRFTASGVTVTDATPNGGFSVDVEPTHGNGIRVEFRSDEHRSRVEGWWDGGPRDQTSEDGA